MLIVAWAVFLIVVLAAVMWLVTLGVIVRTTSALRPATEGLKVQAPADGWPRVTLIVPAHNEQDTIEGCIASLRGQDYENLEIILALDRCTDATAEIARRHAEQDPRLRVLEFGEAADDWFGKNKVMQQSVDASDGRWILFVDADTQMQPQLVRAAAGLMFEHGFDMLGVLPRLRCTHFFEYVAQPVATLQLMQIYPPDKVNRRARARAYGNGPCMMIGRSMFNAIGGMQGVRHEIMEDIALARAIKKAGGQVGVANHGGLLSCAMYDSLSAFEAGWKRIYIGVCKQKIKRLKRYAWRMLAGGVLFPFVQLLALVLGGLLLGRGESTMAAALFVGVAVGWALQALALGRIYLIGGAPLWSALTYPIGCWIVRRTLLNAAGDLQAGSPIKWHGREYRYPAR